MGVKLVGKAPTNLTLVKVMAEQLDPCQSSGRFAGGGHHPPRQPLGIPEQSDGR